MKWACTEVASIKWELVRNNQGGAGDRRHGWMDVPRNENYGTRGGGQAEAGQAREGLWMLGFKDRTEVQGIGRRSRQGGAESNSEA